MKKTITTKIISVMLVIITVFSTSAFCINASAAPSYNVNKAVTYAQKYTDNSGKMSGTYNSSEYNIYKYPNPKAYLGYDCANFVSQCLYAGGMKETNSWRRVTRGQDYKKVTGGTTWVSATELYKYLKKQGYSYETVKSDLSNIHKGDIVFMDFDNNGTADHSTICTGKSGKTPYYCAHSSWRKNYNYSTSQWKGGKAYVIHMSGCKSNSSSSNNNSTVTLKSYTVKSSSGISIRTGAGTSYSKVGGISKGSKIYYTETKKANGYTWAKIVKGTYKSGTWGKTTGYWVALI